MSYAHTKRRKTIAYCKRHHKNWLEVFQGFCRAMRRILDGRCIGTAGDMMKIGEKK